VNGYPDRDNDATTQRRYPRVYEKIVPVALGLIAIAIILLLIVIFAVALGLFPAG
jgi:hypothetical protein